MYDTMWHGTTQCNVSRSISCVVPCVVACLQLGLKYGYLAREDYNNIWAKEVAAVSGKQ